MDFFVIIVSGNVDIYVLNKNIEIEQMFCYNVVINTIFRKCLFLEGVFLDIAFNLRYLLEGVNSITKKYKFYHLNEWLILCNQVNNRLL